MNPGAFLLLLASLLVAPAALASETLYKWTDEDGVVHYSKQPPPDHASESIRVSTSGASSSRRTESPATNAPQTFGSGRPPPEPPEDPESGPGPTPEELAEQKKQLCERGRFLVNTLVGQPQAILTDPDGNVRNLTDQERLDYIDEGRRLKERYCEDEQ